MEARCVQCSKLIRGNLLKYHSKYIHKTEVFNYSCAYSSCSRTFNTWKSLQQHNKKMHSTLFEENELQIESSNQIQLENVTNNNIQQFLTDNIIQPSSYNINANEKLLDSNFALKIAVKLYGDVKLSRKHATKIFKLFEATVNSDIFNSLHSLISQFTNNSQAHDMLQKFIDLQSSFSQLNSEYKVLKKLREMNLLIDPECITFGFRQENSYKSINHIKSTGSFISLTKTLKLFLEKPTILEQTISYIENLQHEEKISNIMQTQFWKLKSSKHTKFVLPLFLYEDDFECGNALGSHAGVYKMSGIYISLPFLPPVFRSQLQNIFLLQIAHSDDIKQYSSKIVYRRIIEELNSLATNGVLIETNGNTLHILFQLTLIVGDNLGLNSILGFTKSFNSNYFCRFCTETKVNSTKSCKVNSSLLRNKIKYEIDIRKNDISQTGIKERCVFNDVNNFHVTENYCADIMHDLFEGVCSYDIGLILHHIIFIQKLFTLNTANFRIKHFDYGNEKNKPPLLTEINLKACHIKMSAAEMKCFILNVSLLFGDLIPQNSHFWKLYILLRQIVCIALQSTISESDITLIDKLITQHHILYVKLFKETLKPKHHNMLHYAHIMKTVGPLVHIWSMRFEAKHSLLKVASHTSCNRQNLPLTIATKHQLYMCKLLFNLESKEKPIIYEKSDTCTECSITELEHIDISNFDEIQYVIIENIKYKHDLIIKISSDDVPTYGSIRKIFKENLRNSEKFNFIFIFQILKCVKKDNHLQSYAVKRTQEHILVKYDSLLFFEPRNCITMSNGQLYIAYDNHIR
ncbi:uncharacterized protein [Prorops nasuta]|uniref:uncharacterized protein n=1 Tax=Prorops nasuta TaxID=863751 RepID=UPI0034CD7BDE